MRLRRQASLVFVGNLVRAGGQFALLAILTLRAGDEEAGRYALSLAVTAMPFLFWNFNLRVVKSTERGAGFSSRAFQMLNGIGILAAIPTSVVAAFAFGATENLKLIAIYCVARAGESISLLVYGSIQRAVKTEILGATLGARGILVLIAGALASTSAEGVVIAVSAVSFGYSILVDLPLARRLGARTARQPGEVSRLARVGLPLAFDALFSSAILTVPRLVVEGVEGLGGLAGFGLVMQMAFAAQLIAGSIGHATIGKLSILANSNDGKKFRVLLNQLRLTALVLAVAVSSVGSIVAPRFLDAIGIELVDAQPLAIAAFVASGFAIVQRVTSRALQATGQYSLYLTLDAIMAGIAAVAAMLLVPSMGIVGGALSVALAFGVGAVAADRLAVRKLEASVTEELS